MRLLKHDNTGQLSLTENFVDANIPAYAILSHTWGTDTEEVTFKDLMDGTGKDKPGYEKIRLCGERARHDGLQYWWVDTCCIDKDSSTVLAEAIISMFRWYQNAARCYVYLSDVSRPAFNVNIKSIQLARELAKSRWFTRGWTLQELLAPASVVFFSKDWEQLGDKKSLEQLICKITRIPVRALQGHSLSTFSVEERLLWSEKRETTREEDNAYSLFGIFDVCLPVLYGEGRGKAFNRLHWEIKKSSIGLDHLPHPANASFDSHIDTPPATAHRGRMTSFRNSKTSGAGSRIKCYRCDNHHLLKDCWATLVTVREARDRRMDSKRCFNCGSKYHFGKDCNREDLLWKR